MRTRDIHKFRKRTSTTIINATSINTDEFSGHNNNNSNSKDNKSSQFIQNKHINSQISHAIKLLQTSSLPKTTISTTEIERPTSTTRSGQCHKPLKKSFNVNNDNGGNNNNSNGNNALHCKTILNDSEGKCVISQSVERNAKKKKKCNTVNNSNNNNKHHIKLNKIANCKRVNLKPKGGNGYKDDIGDNNNDDLGSYEIKQSNGKEICEIITTSASDECTVKIAMSTAIAATDNNNNITNTTQIGRTAIGAVAKRRNQFDDATWRLDVSSSTGSCPTIEEQPPNLNDATQSIISEVELSKSVVKSPATTTTSSSLRSNGGSSPSTTVSNSYSLDFLHSVGVQMTGGANLIASKSTRMRAIRSNNADYSYMNHHHANDNVGMLYGGGGVNDGQRQPISHQRFMSVNNSLNKFQYSNRLSHHYNQTQQHHPHHQQHQQQQQQQPQPHPHQPQQLTIASFLQKGVLEEMLLRSGNERNRNTGVNNVNSNDGDSVGGGGCGIDNGGLNTNCNNNNNGPSSYYNCGNQQRTNNYYQPHRLQQFQHQQHMPQHGYQTTVPHLDYNNSSSTGGIIDPSERHNNLENFGATGNTELSTQSSSSFLHSYHIGNMNQRHSRNHCNYHQQHPRNPLQHQQHLQQSHRYHHQHHRNGNNAMNSQQNSGGSGGGGGNGGAGNNNNNISNGSHIKKSTSSSSSTSSVASTESCGSSLSSASSLSSSSSRNSMNFYRQKMKNANDVGVPGKIDMNIPQRNMQKQHQQQQQQQQQEHQQFRSESNRHQYCNHNRNEKNNYHSNKNRHHHHHHHHHHHNHHHQRQIKHEAMSSVATALHPQNVYNLTYVNAATNNAKPAVSQRQHHSNVKGKEEAHFPMLLHKQQQQVQTNLLQLPLSSSSSSASASSSVSSLISTPTPTLTPPPLSLLPPLASNVLCNSHFDVMGTLPGRIKVPFRAITSHEDCSSINTIIGGNSNYDSDSSLHSSSSQHQLLHNSRLKKSSSSTSSLSSLTHDVTKCNALPSASDAIDSLSISSSEGCAAPTSSSQQNSIDFMYNMLPPLVSNDQYQLNYDSYHSKTHLEEQPKQENPYNQQHLLFTDLPPWFSYNREDYTLLQKKLDHFRGIAETNNNYSCNSFWSPIPFCNVAAIRPPIVPELSTASSTSSLHSQQCVKDPVEGSTINTATDDQEQRSDTPRSECSLSVNQQQQQFLSQNIFPSSLAHNVCGSNPIGSYMHIPLSTADICQRITSPPPQLPVTSYAPQSPIEQTNVPLNLRHKNWCSAMPLSLFYDFYIHTPPDRFLARAHLVEVKETPATLLNNTKWDKLSQDIWNKFISSQQTEDTFKNKMCLWRYLYILVKKTYPRYGLYLVGSTISGFGLNSSDVDMCLVSRSNSAGDPRMEALFNLNVLRDHLNATRDFDAFKLIEAKVPILRFHDRVHQFEVDLNFNNCVGIKNTHLLHCYSQLDWRLRPLILVTKLWAQYHNINNAKNMTISSYSLVLMVIHFLQFAVNPPVLPCLHDLYPDKFPLLRSNDFGYVDMNETIEPFKSKNTQSIGELFLSFLEYYSSFNYSQNAISVRTGGLLPVAACRQMKSLKNDIHQWKELCIEEPFDLTNTARSVYDYETFERVKTVFITSWKLLKEALDINAIFSPINFPPPLFNPPNCVSNVSCNNDVSSESQIQQPPLTFEITETDNMSNEDHLSESNAVIVNNKSDNSNIRNNNNNISALIS